MIVVYCPFLDVMDTCSCCLWSWVTLNDPRWAKATDAERAVDRTPIGTSLGGFCPGVR